MQTTPKSRMGALWCALAAVVGLAGCASPSPGPDDLTQEAYRQRAAAHLYRLNADRIYAGKLPPNLYAVGVLDVVIGAQGQMLTLDWRRAPQHAPEVMAEIEATVRRAQPFPVPPGGQPIRYPDIWLWDRSGRFQLDSLTEGQL